MQVLRFVLIGIIILIMACRQKAVPVITERKAEKPEIKSAAYPPVANVVADTVKGKVLFKMSCGRCHGLPSPSQFTQKVWDGYLATMFPRTNLDNEEAFHVRVYVLVNAQR
jgi:cytochrome c5